MNFSMGVAGAIGGVQVWDWSDPATREQAYKINPMLRDIELRYDQMYVAVGQQALIVGELAHWLYRLQQHALNHELRERVEAMLNSFALRTIGTTLAAFDEPRPTHVEDFDGQIEMDFRLDSR